MASCSGHPAEAQTRARQSLAVVALTLAKRHPDDANELEWLAWRLRDEADPAPWDELYLTLVRLEDDTARRWGEAMELVGLVAP